MTMYTMAYHETPKENTLDQQRFGLVMSENWCVSVSVLTL